MFGGVVIYQTLKSSRRYHNVRSVPYSQVCGIVIHTTGLFKVDQKLLYFHVKYSNLIGQGTVDKTYCFPLRIKNTPTRVIVSSNGKHCLTTGNILKNCYMRQIYARTVRRRLLDDVVWAFVINVITNMDVRNIAWQWSKSTDETVCCFYDIQYNKIIRLGWQCFSQCENFRCCSQLHAIFILLYWMSKK